MNKVLASPAEAVADVRDGSTIGIAGFGIGHRAPNSLVEALGQQGAKDLHIVSNGLNSATREHLVDKGRVSWFSGAFAPRNRPPGSAERMIAEGTMRLELVPQGIMVERCRAAGAGIPAFYSPTGADTLLAEGKDIRYFDGKAYVLETALHLDYAFFHAYRADRMGNVQFRGGSQNFGTSFAKAARVAIAEVEQIVEVGELDPNQIDLPCSLVARVVKSTAAVDLEKLLESRRGRKRPPDIPKQYNGKAALTRAAAAKRAAMLLPEGSVVNLGVGIPTMVSNYLEGRDVMLHAENGVLGYSEQVAGDGIDLDVYNAGGEFVNLRQGASFFDSVTSFEMARGGKLNAVILGAYQVDQDGNLANWTTDGPTEAGIGGAMDLVAGRKTLIIVMEHRDSQDRPKLVRKVAYPPTGTDCVNIVVTDLALLERRNGRFTLLEVAPGFSVEEVVALTDMEVDLAPEVRTMPV
jgi:3-oxoacid CoA-transferase